jgi:hypothetical protein
LIAIKDPGERARIARTDLRRGGQRRLVCDVRERVDRRLQLVDPSQRLLDELARAELA